MLLVLGPFVLLLLFGAGYKDADDPAAHRVRRSGRDRCTSRPSPTTPTSSSEYIDPMGFTSDEDAAVERLDDGDLDAVVVFPTDALEQILGGESAKIEILHEKLDPFQQTAIDIASRLAVQEVNASVLGADRRRCPGGRWPPVDEAASAPHRAGGGAVGRRRRRRHARRWRSAPRAVGETLRDTPLVVTTSQDVVERLGGETDGRRRPTSSPASTRPPPTPTRSAPGAARRRLGRATALAVDAARRSPRRSLRSTTVDPAVLVRPFEADTENIAPVEIEPVDFFAPSSIALLLQHLALTFAALSLVRDRELGLLELLRVGPLSSMRDPRRQDDRLPRSSDSPSVRRC